MQRDRIDRNEEACRRTILSSIAASITRLSKPDAGRPAAAEFEAVSKLPKKEQDTVKTVIDSILLMSDARRYTAKAAA